jgi:hypothetical protein
LLFQLIFNEFQLALEKPGLVLEKGFFLGGIGNSNRSRHATTHPAWQASRTREPSESAAVSEACTKSGVRTGRETGARPDASACFQTHSAWSCSIFSWHNLHLLSLNIHTDEPMPIININRLWANVNIRSSVLEQRF